MSADSSTCRAISIETLHDIDAFVASTPGISRCFEWYSVFFALQAALTLLLSCLSEPQHADIASWHQVLTLTAQWFRRMTTMASVRSAFSQC
jgi:transcriptional regulatory protein GAL4